MADEQTTAAVAHWRHRFVSNGIPLHDYEVTAGPIERWDQWCTAWVERGHVHEAMGEEALTRGHDRTAGEHLVRASRCYHFGKFVFVERFEEMREAHRLAVSAYDRALPHLRPHGQRVAVPYGDHELYGILRVPPAVRPPPLVLMVAGLDSTKEELGAYEQHLLDRGLATFAFDGPGQGESEYTIPMRPDYEVPVAAVLDHLAMRAEIDASRAGLYGVSLGGHYVVRAAAFEDRIGACASISGSYRIADSWAQRPRMNRASYRVRAHLDSEEEAAAFVQHFDLEGVVAKVTCPLYLVAGTHDRLTPHAAAERMAAEASGPTVLDVVQGGNHVVNNMPYRYRSQVADWLAETLGAEVGP